MKRSSFFIAILLLVLGGGLGGWWMSRSHKPVVQDPSIDGSVSGKGGQVVPTPRASEPAGGPSANTSDHVAAIAVPNTAPHATPVGPRPDQPGGPLSYGRVESVKADANPAVAGVVEAAKTGTHPERLTPMVPAPPFDLAAWKADPDRVAAAYVAEHVPGRMFQTQQPGPQVPILRPIGQTAFHIVQGQSVSLRVLVPPKGLATFVSLDLGTFSNGLACISVRADERGVASATLRAGPGTLHDIKVQAASPLCSEVVRFVVSVDPVSASTPNKEPQS